MMNNILLYLYANLVSQLTVLHLRKQYHKRCVVQDVSLQLHTGEIVGLLGPNGAGKTTSFYMIVGMIAPDGGQVCLDSQDITYLPIHARARLGISYLPQEASIFRKLSVADNILAMLEQRPDLSKQARLTQLESLLEKFHLTALKTIKGLALSGGERRRVEIARTLAMSPKFILLDEPFAGVDPISVVEIKQIMQTLSHQGIGLLITDHNVRETLDICERAYIVHEGTIMAEGTPATILNDSKVRSVYLGESFTL